MADSASAPQSVAIVGIAERFPRTPDLALLWDKLPSGTECVDFFADE